MPLNRAPGHWYWKQAAEGRWYRVNDELGIEDGPHPKQYSDGTVKFAIKRGILYAEADELMDDMLDALGEAAREKRDAIRAIIKPGGSS